MMEMHGHAQHHCRRFAIWGGTVGVISRNTSSTAQGGGGNFKNMKPIGEVGCCDLWMAERIH